jgi:hypothetical protein
MSTRGMVAVQQGMNGRYKLYYRHTDTYPTGLGYDLISKLKATQTFGWQQKEIEKILQEVGCRFEGEYVDKPEDAFLKVQGDLEYIYVIEDLDNPTALSVQILRTSDPYFLEPRVEFVYPIYFSYVSDVSVHPHELMADMARVECTSDMILNALEAYHKAVAKVMATPFQ